ncbi:hypothetical protein OG625_40175 (plasmid) [Streptomyces sp. NBC_01351]|uniref:hypothetical protein n=1 Tax=Streptomyces sp. NBC_01351 TaxID=2903833 RepID=UPI002E2FFAE3|nr:hypothetical protein [Streptomyces sp. NBC_01351]
MLEEMLKAQAQALHDEYDDHDTTGFLRRLADHINEEAQRPPRVRMANQPYDAAAEPEGPAAAPPSRAQVMAPAQGPEARTRAQSFVRPRGRRPMRRRPTPIAPLDPSVSPAAVIDYVRRLCEVVLASKDVERLESFDEDYDQAGARTYACLLYTLGQHTGALYWWRFAAGAGDALAAHLLASHHAAVGLAPDARVWRAFAQMLGFSNEHHVPTPVHTETMLAEHFAVRVPWDQERQSFFRGLPRDLATR